MIDRHHTVYLASERIKQERSTHITAIGACVPITVMGTTQTDRPIHNFHSYYIPTLISLVTNWRDWEVYTHTSNWNVRTHYSNGYNQLEDAFDPTVTLPVLLCWQHLVIENSGSFSACHTCQQWLSTFQLFRRQALKTVFGWTNAFFSNRPLINAQSRFSWMFVRWSSRTL